MVSTPFTIIPAIDLLDGRVVRLREGDFARVTGYSGDPVGVAVGFAAAGASWIHLVDLDGARDGAPRRLAEVASISEALPSQCRLEVAGGIRDAAAVAAALDAGASRVVLGTALIGDQALAERLVGRFGAERIVAALDVRAGQAVGNGWILGGRSDDAVAVARGLADAGIRTFEVTAIERDGTLAGPDIALVAGLVALGIADIVASAGVRDLADLLALRSAGCAGAIVGRAIYEGRLDLGEAIASTTAEPEA